MTLANLVQQTAGEAGAVDAQQDFRHLHCSAGKQATRGFAESRWLRAVKQLRRSAAFRVCGFVDRGCRLLCSQDTLFDI